MNLYCPSIVIVDIDTATPLAERQRVAAALQRQVLEHFAPAWGISASVRAASPNDPPRADEIRAELRKVPTQEGALAFHDVTPAGLPIMYVFPLLCAAMGESWSVALGHEVFETLADPLLRRGVQDDQGVWYAAEVCDAVESDTYDIDGVTMTNFCTPQWGEPPANRAGVKYDYLGLCTKPFEIRPGGYGQTWDPSKGWSTVGQLSAYRTKVGALGLGRGNLRRETVPRPSAWTRLLRWLGC